MAEEPVPKKIKLSDDFDSLILSIRDSTENLTAILSDEYYRDVEITDLFAGHVVNPKSLSTVICLLNDKLPLPNFQHLKRVHGRLVLLCPVSFIKDSSPQSNIQDFLNEKLPELSKNIFDYIRIVGVPLYPPKTKAQYKEWNRKWNSSFHPDKYIEKLINKTLFKVSDVTQHRLYMTIVIEIAKWYSEKNNLFINQEGSISGNINAAVVVDPLKNSIVAMSIDNRNTHPIQHASMLVIDNVAKTQNGGAWNLNSTDLFGIDKSAFLHLKSKYRQIEFGCRKFISKSDMTESEQLNCPYLCTGYYIYLIREPCIMCAMGLVHARIKRIFFCYKNEKQGALVSKDKLHCVQSLNHRFEVFTGFL